jgi:RND family efflux transporter MFP subunit
MMRVALIAALAALATACGGNAKAPEAEAAAERPVVRTIVVGADATGGEVRASGTIGYQREPALSFRTPGVIERIVVDEGDRVRRGQRLAWVRPTEVAAGVAEADAALATARKNLERTETLFAKGFVSQARLDDAKLAVERAEAAAKTRDFSADTAVIFAPADGVILRRLAEPAQIAAAGQSIFLFGETGSGIVARAAFAPGLAARIRTGDAAEARVPDARAEPFAGKVLRMSGKSDAATGAFDVEIALSGAQGLKSGQIAEISVAANGGKGAAIQRMTIPTLALIDARADQGAVFVIDEKGLARRRGVETGGLVGDSVVVLAGLKPGETIVAAGAAYVRDGEPVTVAAQP